MRLRVGGERYAVAVENVLEVAELGTLSPVPGGGSAVLGVRNLRGQVLPVFDLASRPRDQRATASPRCLLVAEHGGLRAGFAVDEVTDVGAAPGRSARRRTSKLLAGAALDDGRLVGVIDVERLFADLA